MSKVLKILSPKATLSILTGLNLLNYIDRYILASVLTPLKDELGLSDGQLGRISTAFMLGYFVTCPFFGYLGDRYSRKWLIALGIFVWSLGTVLTGIAGGFVGLMLYRVLVGFGEASYATLSPSWIADVFPTNKRNNAITIFYTAIPVGAALGYILGGIISAHYGWREAFIWAGIPGLLLALLLLPYQEPRPGEADGTDGMISSIQQRIHWNEVFQILKISNFNYVCWGYTAYTFAMGAYAYWAPTFLSRIHHVPPEKAATFIGGVLVVAGFLGTLGGGWWATHLQKKNQGGYALVSGISTLMAAPVTWAAFTLENMYSSGAMMALAMLLLFLSTGPVNTIILESVPFKLRGSAMALTLFLTHLFGDLASPEIVGHLADYFKNIAKGLLILPLFLLISGVLWTFLGFRMSKTSASKPL